MHATESGPIATSRVLRFRHMSWLDEQIAKADVAHSIKLCRMLCFVKYIITLNRYAHGNTVQALRQVEITFWITAELCILSTPLSGSAEKATQG
jgi:hypothetical protein